MELKKLDKKVLKLWYIHAGIMSLVLLGIFTITFIILNIPGVPDDVKHAVLLGVGILVALLLVFALIMPALRYKMYAWGYDDKRIVVKQGVIFRQRVVIPICQIQDLHSAQGPIMMMLKLSVVTLSTVGSNFSISTLTTDEAERMINDLERHLETRIEELKNEEI